MVQKFNLKQLRGMVMSALAVAGTYAVVSILGAHDAHAQSISNLGGVISNVGGNIHQAANLVYMAAYTGGVTALMMGAFKLKAHTENPGQTPMSHGLGRIGAGAALCALPSIANTVMNTMGQSNSASLSGGTITTSNIMGN